MSIYSDINMFTANVNPRVIDFDSVAQSIYSILSTKKGERLFKPDFGCDIEKYLFEPCDDITSEKIYLEIYQAITRWDTRIILINSKSTVVANPENHSYTIKLIFKIAGLGDTYFDSTYTLIGREDN